jgi:Berberine and berberine like
MIQFGFFFWALDQGAEALRFMRDLAERLPRELTPIIGAMSAPPAPFVPEQHHFQPGYVLMIGGFGTSEQHSAAVEQVRAECPPLFDFVTLMPFTALQQLFDEANSWGQAYCQRSVYVEEITDSMIDIVTEQVPRKTSALSVTLWYKLDQSYTEVGEDDTAFGGGRTPRYAVFVVAAAPTSDILHADRTWVEEFADALRPVPLGDTTYVNAMSEYDEDRVVASYGKAKYARLARIKGVYDPGNAFHRNINIKPA